MSIVVDAAIAASPPVRMPDKLDRLRALCEEFRDLEAEISDLEDRLKAARSAREQMRTAAIPEQMDVCGVAGIDLLPRGNFPAERVEVRPEVRASIAAAWTDEKKRAAYDYLDGVGSGDLIKTTVTIYFPRERRADAVKLAAELKPLRVQVDVDEAVHWSTLSKWLRERVAKGLKTDFEAIGGYSGRTAKVTAMK